MGNGEIKRYRGLTSVCRAILIRGRDNGEFSEFNCSSFDRAAYEAFLPEWQED